MTAWVTDASPRAFQRRQRTRLDPYPRGPIARWGLRLLLGIPPLILAMLGSLGGAEQLATPNAQLIEAVAKIDWGRADAAWIGEIFPPLSTLIALILGWAGPFGLAVAGALIAGIFLQKMAEIMVQRRFPLPLRTALFLALGYTPLFWYTATENFAAFLGLAFFGLGVAEMVRFVAWGNTRAGFTAGMLLMLAVLSDLSGPLYVLTAAVAAPFLTLGRRHGRRARWANVLVIVYPTIAALAAILLLNAIFLGDPFAGYIEGLLAGAADRASNIGAFYATVSGWLVIATVLSAWIVALIVRRPGSILVSTLVFASINLAVVAGLIPSGSAGNTYLLMILMAIALVPAAKGAVTGSLMVVVGALQFGIGWASAYTRPIVLEWMGTVADGLVRILGS